MKAMLRNIDDHGLKYQALAFICPGCVRTDGGTGLHMLPVNTTVKSPSWDFDGNLETPTLSPSILTKWGDKFVCHSFLRAGVFEFLTDCSHAMAGQSVPMVDLPEWFTNRNET